jgi:Predicted protein-tyrosine phosphatase
MEDSPIQRVKLAPSQIEIGSPGQEIIIEVSKKHPINGPVIRLESLGDAVTSIGHDCAQGFDTHTSEQKSKAPKHDRNTQLSAGDKKKLDKWRHDKKFGTVVEGTNILPCKVFLNDEKWHPHLEPSEHFYLEDLVNHLHKQGQKLSLIIDLNRSFDYYNFSEVATKTSLLRETEYKKFILENAEVPNDEIVDEIYGILKDYHEKGKFVAIHCFNGINRTGYIVCDFLCRYFGMDAEEAIRKFEEARQHKIEHLSLVTKLKERYPSREC